MKHVKMRWDQDTVGYEGLPEDVNMRRLRGWSTQWIDICVGLIEEVNDFEGMTRCEGQRMW